MTLNRVAIWKPLRSAAGARAGASGRECVDTRPATFSLPSSISLHRVPPVPRAISARRLPDILREAASVRLDLSARKCAQHIVEQVSASVSAAGDERDNAAFCPRVDCLDGLT